MGRSSSRLRSHLLLTLFAIALALTINPIALLPSGSINVYLDRSGQLNVVSASSDGILNLSKTDNVSTGTTSQQVVVVTNTLTHTQNVTVHLSTDVSNWHLSSTGTTTRTVTLAPGAQETFQVDVGSDAVTGPARYWVNVSAGNYSFTHRATVNVTGSGGGGGGGGGTSRPIIGEVGTITLDQNGYNSFETVTFNHTYDHPVVIVSAASYNDTAPVSNVRIRNVTNTSFEARIDEWDYLDQQHANETVHYIVMEKGNHTLPDGRKVRVGTFVGTTNGKRYPTHSRIPFHAAFLQVQAYNGSDAVFARPNVRRTGTDIIGVALREQESTDTSHVDEQTGYILVEQGVGSVNATDYEISITQKAITHKWHTRRFLYNHSPTGPLLTTWWTYDGLNTVTPRINNRTAARVDFLADEEQSADSETNHTQEEALGYWVFDEPTTITACESGDCESTSTHDTIIGEVGQTTLDQAGYSSFETIQFNHTYDDPVVFMSPPSYTDSAPLAGVRIRNVTSTSVEARLDEWDSLDQQHANETVTYVVLEEGSYQLSGGRKLDVREMAVENDQEQLWARFGFNRSTMMDTQLQSYNETDAAVTHHFDHTLTGIRASIREQQSGGDHQLEAIGYLAVSVGNGTINGSRSEVQFGTRYPTDLWADTRFTEPYTSPPLVLASAQTTFFTESWALRYSNLTASSMSFRVQEEQSGDSETDHLEEPVAYWAFGNTTTITGTPVTPQWTRNLAPVGSVESVTDNSWCKNDGPSPGCDGTWIAKFNISWAGFDTEANLTNVTVQLVRSGSVVNETTITATGQWQHGTTTLSESGTSSGTTYTIRVRPHDAAALTDTGSETYTSN